jgi:hypothetical protein
MIAFQSDMIQLPHTIPIFILVSRIARTHQDFFLSPLGIYQVSLTPFPSPPSEGYLEPLQPE